MRMYKRCIVRKLAVDRNGVGMAFVHVLGLHKIDYRKLRMNNY